MHRAPIWPPAWRARKASRPSCRSNVLAGVASGSKPQVRLPKRVLLLDYRFLELLGPVNGAQIFDKAEPALLAALAQDATRRRAPQDRRRGDRAASQRADAGSAGRPVSPPRILAKRAVRSDRQPQDPLLRRALLFRGIELSRSPAQQARMASALLDDARRSTAAVQTARMLAPMLD